MAKKDIFDEAIEAFGGIEQMFRDGDDFDRRHMLLYSRIIELIKERPNQWVALAEGDVWVFADSHAELLRCMDQQGLRRNNAVYEHLDPDPPILILAAGSL
ncbi:MAG: hypothetical protein OXC99_12455 [Chloroflexi bacterium]|nr:hypothetical protein [Chloroflexota bacterium]